MEFGFGTLMFIVFAIFSAYTLFNHFMGAPFVGEWINPTSTKEHYEVLVVEVEMETYPTFLEQMQGQGWRLTDIDTETEFTYKVRMVRDLGDAPDV